MMMMHWAILVLDGGHGHGHKAMDWIEGGLEESFSTTVPSALPLNHPKVSFGSKGKT